MTDVPPVKRSFYITLGIMALMMAVYSPSFLFNGSIPAGLWKYGLLLGVLGAVVPIVFFATGMPKIGAGNGTILSAAELPAAVIAAQTILHETVLIVQWLGILLILTGIAFPFLAKRRSHPVL